MPLLYKINTPTSTKRKADDQNELHAIKKLKTFHISSIDTTKRKNENGSDRPNKKQKLTNFDEDDTPPGTQWDGNNYSCAYGALFTICSTYGQQNQKNGKEYSKSPINIFLHCMMDSKNI